MPRLWGAFYWTVFARDLVGESFAEERRRLNREMTRPRLAEPLVFIPVLVRPMAIRPIPRELIKGSHARAKSRLISGEVIPRRYRVELRGKYRIAGAAEYRLYRRLGAPPAEGDTPFATASSLPHTPSDTFSDGVWYVSVSYYNGYIDSGFLPLGQSGETWQRLEIISGVRFYDVPYAPQSWSLANIGDGVVRVTAYYRQRGGLRADEWAIAYTTDGTDPPEHTPDVTVTIKPQGMAILEYDLPAQSGGTVVKVRLQVRRNDGSVIIPVWRYSEGSAVQTITATVAFPGSASAPLRGFRWVGRLPEGR